VTRAVLSIGSNVGDRLAHLRSVVDGFGSRVRAVSAVYSTPPWGGVHQDDFLNAVLLVEDPTCTAADWLARGQELEAAAHRVRPVHWGPRTLDVDVIVVTGPAGMVRSDDPRLTLPHPHAWRRAFVLVPWLDVEPEATLPVAGELRPVRELLAELDAAEVAAVRRLEVTV
jgi:2-amino-4-hydroxy-6-hydroxymethyldihydropteridine diphosphokinase